MYLFFNQIAQNKVKISLDHFNPKSQKAIIVDTQFFPGSCHASCLLPALFKKC